MCTPSLFQQHYKQTHTSDYLKGVRKSVGCEHGWVEQQPFLQHMWWWGHTHHYWHIWKSSSASASPFSPYSRSVSSNKHEPVKVSLENKEPQVSFDPPHSISVSKPPLTLKSSLFQQSFRDQNRFHPKRFQHNELSGKLCMCYERARCASVWCNQINNSDLNCMFSISPYQCSVTVSDVGGCEDWCGYMLIWESLLSWTISLSPLFAAERAVSVGPKWYILCVCIHTALT